MLSDRSQTGVHRHSGYKPYATAQILSKAILEILKNSDILLKQLTNRFFLPPPHSFPYVQEHPLCNAVSSLPYFS